MSAVDWHEHRDPEEIRALLVRQLSSPVRWTQTVSALTGGGIRTIVECGPGGVLAGLVQRIERRRETQVFALEDPESFPAAIAAAAA